MAILKRTSSFVVDKLEQLFYKWGCFVSKHPKRVIFGCLLITALSALGFFNIRAESRAEKLWISPKSPYISDKEWLDTHFPRNTRHNIALFVAGNRRSFLEGWIHVTVHPIILSFAAVVASSTLGDLRRILFI